MRMSWQRIISDYVNEKISFEDLSTWICRSFGLDHIESKMQPESNLRSASPNLAVEMVKRYVDYVREQAELCLHRDQVGLLPPAVEQENKKCESIDSEIQIGDHSAFPKLVVSIENTKMNIIQEKKKPKLRIRTTLVKEEDIGSPITLKPLLYSEDSISSPSSMSRTILTTRSFGAISSGPFTSCSIDKMNDEKHINDSIAAFNNLKTPPKPRMLVLAAPKPSKKCKSASSIQSKPEDCIDSSAASRESRKFGQLFGLLIRLRLANRFVQDLKLLLRLLCIQKITKSDKNEFETTPIFFKVASCKHFAVAALEEIGPDFYGVGISTLQLIQSAVEIHQPQHGILQQIEQSIKRIQSRAMSENDAYGSILDGTKSVSTSDFALPFREDTDSRHNFRTQSHALVYRNREQTRDAFLRLLRDFQEKKSGIVRSFSGHLSDTQQFKKTPWEILDELLPCNMVWFAEFFVMELLQVGVIPLAEQDQDVLTHKSIGKDHDRLQKLHRRFSNPNATGASTKGKTFGNNHPKKKSFGQSIPPQDGQSTELVGLSQDKWKIMFTENMEFFENFLTTTDSHRLNAILVDLMKSKIKNLMSFTECKDLLTSFAERSLHLRVLARCLAYLLFAPRWDTLPSRESIAFEIANEEAVEVVDCLDPPFDVLTYMEQAVKGMYLIIAIPWICDYMRLMMCDPIYSRTRYAQRCLQMLKRIYVSRRYAERGDHSVSVAILVQLESLFENIHLNICEKVTIGSGPIHEREEVAWDWTNRSERASLDSIVSIITPWYIQKYVSQLEELYQFVLSLSRVSFYLEQEQRLLTEMKLPKKNIRKMRPSVVSTGATLSMTKKMDISALNDKFLRQHPILKKSLDFIIESISRDITEEVVVPCVDVIFQDASSSFQNLSGPLCPTEPISPKPFMQYNTALNNMVTCKFHAFCNQKIMDTITALHGSSMPFQVVEAAINIGLSRATVEYLPIALARGSTLYVKRCNQLVETVCKSKGIDAFEKSAGCPTSSTTSSVIRNLCLDFDDNLRLTTKSSGSNGFTSGLQIEECQAVDVNHLVVQKLLADSVAEVFKFLEIRMKGVPTPDWAPFIENFNIIVNGSKTLLDSDFSRGAIFCWSRLQLIVRGLLDVLVVLSFKKTDISFGEALNNIFCTQLNELVCYDSTRALAVALIEEELFEPRRIFQAIETPHETATDSAYRTNLRASFKRIWSCAIRNGDDAMIFRVEGRIASYMAQLPTLQQNKYHMFALSVLHSTPQQKWGEALGKEDGLSLSSRRPDFKALSASSNDSVQQPLGPPPATSLSSPSSLPNGN